jgi:hypothetical protein
MSELKELSDICGWLRETKGITKIDLLELVSYKKEYDEYLKLKQN